MVHLALCKRKRQNLIAHSGQYLRVCWTVDQDLRLEEQLLGPWTGMHALSWDARILGRSVCRNQGTGA